MDKEPTKSAQAAKPTTLPFGETKKNVTFESVFSRWRQYHMARYAENYSQDDEKIFVEEYQKDGGSLSDLVKLGDLAYSYETTKNHTILPDLLVLAHRLKVYPPTSVLAHLAKGLQTFSESKGRKSLDTCLGIQGKRGPRSRLTQQEEKTRDQHYVCGIRFYTIVQELRIEDACMLAANQYHGPLKLSIETIKRKWRSKEWKAYRSTLDEDELSVIKKSHPSSRGKPLTPAKLLKPIALHLALTRQFPTEKRKCMETIERTMQIAGLVPETSDYLPRIQKVLDDKKTYPRVTQQIRVLRNIIREALEDPKNPLEFPKNIPPDKAYLIKHLSS